MATAATYSGESSTVTEYLKHLYVLLLSDFLSVHLNSSDGPKRVMDPRVLTLTTHLRVGVDFLLPDGVALPIGETRDSPSLPK